MFAYEKFDVFDEIVSSWPEEGSLTYSPLLREGVLFCLEGAEKIRDVHADERRVLSGVDASLYPPKRSIKKIGYFYDERFLSNILAEFEAQDVEIEKLALLPARLKKVLSSKQREEINFFDHHLQASFGCHIRTRLEERFHLVNAMIPEYYTLLKNAGVDAVVFRVYYGLNYFPIIFACKMLGITVIDVQHGINGLKHPAYSKFKSWEADSPFLPDVFWTWSDMATRMLVNDSALASESRIVEGGNPIFETAKSTSSALSATGQEKGNRILYTHQPQSKGIPVPVDAISKVHRMKGQKVVIRPHPLHVDEAQKVNTLLKKAGVKCALEDPAKVSLNESLAKASVHVTYSSTCALDALNLGIPSVYCSDYIGDVERKFATGLLFRPEEIHKDLLARNSNKAIDYSVGTSDKIHAGVSQLLASTNREKR